MRLPKLSRPSFDWRRLGRSLSRSKLLWSLAVVVLLYTLGGFLLAPYLVQRYLPSLAQEHLGRSATVEKVRINPYTLTVEANGFRLHDRGEKHLLAFKRLFVNLQASSLFKRVWTLADIELEGADLALEIDKNGRLNLLDVLDRLLKPSKPDEPPPRMVLDHLRVQDSRVGLVDLSQEPTATAAFTPVNFELWNLSTLADHQGRYTLNAKLPAGGTLVWKGTVSLQPIASSGELAMKGAKLEAAWRFLRDEFNLGEPRGDVSIAGHYDFAYSPGKTALDVKGVTIELAGLSVAMSGEKQPLIALRKASVSDASFALANREIVLPKLVLADGALNATVSEKRVLDWARIAVTAPPAKPAAAAEPQRPAAPSQPWRIRMPGIAIDKVALSFTDRSTSPALSIGTAGLTARLNLDITSGADARVVADEIALAFARAAATIPGSETRFASWEAASLVGGRIDTQERVVHAKMLELKQGDFTVAIGPEGPEGLLKALSAPSQTSVPEADPKSAQSQAAPWRIRIDKVGIEKLAFQYDDRSGKPGFAIRTPESSGAFSLEASAGGGAARMVAADLQLAIDRLRLDARGSDAPLATLDALRITGGRIDTGERVLAAKTIALSGGGTRLARAPDGSIALVDTFASGSAQTPSRAPAPREEAAAAAAWRYRIEAIDLKRFAVALADGTYKPAIAYDVEVSSASVNNVDPGSKKPIAFNASLRVGKDASATGEGTLQQDYAGANARVALTRLQLEPLQPLLAKYTTLDLKSGQASAKARVTWQRAGKPALLVRSQLSVDDVLINEAGTNERFASWKTLAADSAELSLAPDKLTVRQVRVIEPGAKLVISRDRTINITHVVKKQAGPEAAPARQGAAEESGFPYDIARIRFDNGTLDFADLSLVLPFATQVQALDGAIVGISSDPDARAEVKLTGQVDKYGEARADGVLIPHDPEKFLDITARFNNIDMALLSPYSATFAGRKVADGRLALVLEYKIVNSQLAGQNKIALRDFKLGERVEAPNALDLPLDLAIALLKDSEGRINLEVPVSGHVGSPEFDYGKVIRTAIANAIGRIVTAPFRALASLFGKRDSDAVRTVSFEPGSDLLAPAQREELDALAKALKARPQLKIVVKGPYDSARDASELKRTQARLDLARALRARLAPGEDPGPIAYGRADTQRALERLLAERAGPDALAELEKSFAKRTGRQPERVNPVLGLVGRGSKDTEFYEAVFERLVEAEPLSETAVRELAASRAQAIIDALAKSGVARERLTSGGITQVKADAQKGVATELGLGV